MNASGWLRSIVGGSVATRGPLHVAALMQVDHISCCSYGQLRAFRVNQVWEVFFLCLKPAFRAGSSGAPSEFIRNACIRSFGLDRIGLQLAPSLGLILWYHVCIYHVCICVLFTMRQKFVVWCFLNGISLLILQMYNWNHDSIGCNVAKFGSSRIIHV